MKLLLHADVPKLGYFGDVVEVKEGYARNYLIPQCLAVEPSQVNIKAIEEERAKKAQERNLVRERLMKTVAKVEGAEVTINTLANETGHLFGSVSEDDIASALLAKGFEIQTRHIQLGEHIRKIGSHEIKLRFADDLLANVTVNVVRPEDETSESQPETDQPE